MFVLFVSFDVLAHSQTDIGKQDITHFIPKGYKLFDKIYGDLNQDGATDCVLIIKAMRKDGFVKGDDGKVIDRNRRGIIILFSKHEGYEVALKNYDCFSSENEDGGVYDPPELSINIRRGKLYVDYNYGRYGFWSYCFRYQDSDFALIGLRIGVQQSLQRKASISLQVLNILIKISIVRILMGRKCSEERS